MIDDEMDRQIVRKMVDISYNWLMWGLASLKAIGQASERNSGQS